MAYSVVERCGCGATMNITCYPIERGYELAREFRASHQHIEPLPAPAPVVQRVVIGSRPRVRRPRTLGRSTRTSDPSSTGQMS